jgi:murein DD-endopeptidase MepM/ murein hydrolase activator NlpD
MTAALAAAPVVPRGIAAAAGPESNPAVAGAIDGHDALLRAAAGRIVLREGTQGGLVAAAQRRLNDVLPLTHLAVDGIFGPVTRGAVLDFQRREGLLTTGMIDARTWAVLFKAPVLVMGAGNASGVWNASNVGASASSGRTGFVGSAAAAARVAASGATQTAATGAVNDAASTAGSSDLGDASNASGSSGVATSGSPGSGTSGSSSAGASGSGSGQQVAVVSPTSPPPQSSTYVLTNGVALPLPRQYLVNGSVDQGVDYAAPGGTPLYAMGDGVIIGEGISGFGPNAPVLKITSGPLKGLIVYYGHAGSDLVHVGDHVQAGQQISEVGYGIVGISTGPHLEIGVYPPGPMGAGSRMLSIINSLLSQHSSGRASTATAKTARATTARATGAHVVNGASTAVTTASNAAPAGTSSASVASGGSASASASGISSYASGGTSPTVADSTDAAAAATDSQLTGSSDSGGSSSSSTPVGSSGSVTATADPQTPSAAQQDPGTSQQAASTAQWQGSVSGSDQGVDQTASQSQVDQSVSQSHPDPSASGSQVDQSASQSPVDQAVAQPQADPATTQDQSTSQSQTDPTSTTADSTASADSTSTAGVDTASATTATPDSSTADQATGSTG